MDHHTESASDVPEANWESLICAEPENFNVMMQLLHFGSLNSINPSVYWPEHDSSSSSYHYCSTDGSNSHSGCYYLDESNTSVLGSLQGSFPWKKQPFLDNISNVNSDHHMPFSAKRRVDFAESLELENNSSLKKARAANNVQKGKRKSKKTQKSKKSCESEDDRRINTNNNSSEDESCESEENNGSRSKGCEVSATPNQGRFRSGSGSLQPSTPATANCRSRLGHREVACDSTPHRHGVGSSHAPTGYFCHFSSSLQGNEFLLPSSNIRAAESSSSSMIRGAGNTRNTELAYIRNDRLPGAVLQARARLLERLRGVSLTGTRQRTRVNSISWDELLVSADFRTTNSDGMVNESPTEWIDYVSQLADSANQEESMVSIQSRNKKPPGLGQDAVNSLRREVFGNETTVDSYECSICLEKFLKGDALIRLPCSHRFHPTCLVPWVKTCGDCPYCRTVIVVR